MKGYSYMENFAKLLTEEKTIKLTKFFKVLGDETRVKILSLLFQRSCTVNEISAAINMEHSAVSHQLRVLKKHRLVKNKKLGRYQLYSLDDDHVVNIFKMAYVHLAEERNES